MVSFSLVSYVHRALISAGKTTFFVANQANLEDVPPGKLASLESGFKALEEENKQSLAQIKSKQAGMLHICALYPLFSLNLQ